MKLFFYFRNLLFKSFLFFLIHQTTDASDFISGHLMGQLGNQFFIIAATTSLALDHGVKATFPSFLSSDEPIFNLSLNHEKIFSSLNTETPENHPSMIYREPQFSYSPIPYQPNMQLFGWFQSEKYFKHHKKEILTLFAPSPAISKYLKNTYPSLLDNPKTVAIHFRSYLKEDPHQKVYPLCSLEYYEKAMSLFPQDALFLVFSNDMPFCKTFFSSLSANFIFIEEEPYYHDFYLMSLCKHQIICNSSFSWWAAYLNPNPDKIVIAPFHWFTKDYLADTKDLLPEDWIVLD